VAIPPVISQKNRIVGSVLICPFPKISPIWGYFETEPDTGFFWGMMRVIGGHIGPGLGWACTLPARKTRWKRHPFPPIARKKNTNKDFPVFPGKCPARQLNIFKKDRGAGLEDSGKISVTREKSGNPGSVLALQPYI